ncbi:MAG: GNAT family N-acetyltransferase [Pseudomonadota bacterium]
MTIRVVTEKDLDRCFEIESAAFSGDEAASRDKIHKRILGYPEGFLVLEHDESIVGFINSGATNKVALADEAFKELLGHDPDGEHAVILSVAVHPDFQGRGFASKLMKAFIVRMKDRGKSDIHLICQKALIGMYAKFGFADLGPSSSNHGGLRWHEMALSLRDTKKPANAGFHDE